jgi:hypothetical protein
MVVPSNGEVGAGLKGVVGVGINWRQAERQEFEWVFEQLMLREHRGAADVVRIPDDRGGDGGIDILVDYPNRRLVYQLKFYTDGLSSNEKTRKGRSSGRSTRR